MKAAAPFFVVLLSLFSLQTAAKTFPVTTTADDGPGSLRQALTDANAFECSFEERCNIAFALPAPVPDAGWFTIRPTSPLPIIERGWISIDGATQTGTTGDTNPLGPEIELDGTSAGSRSGLKVVATYGLTINGLCVNRFQGHGIFLDGSGGAWLKNNYVGVDPTGSRAMPNLLDGIALRAVGGTRVESNVVSGNRGNGIYAPDAKGVSITGNRVGLAASSDIAISNSSSGIDVSGTGWVDDNVVAHNALFGVAFVGEIALSGNEVFANGLLDVTRWNVPDPTMTQPPVLTSAMELPRQGGVGSVPVITGSVHAEPGAEVLVRAYLAPYRDANGLVGERILVGEETVVTDGSGNAKLAFDDLLALPVTNLYGGYVAATAQELDRGKRESPLSAAIPLTITTRTFEVISTADSGAGSLRDAIERANSAACAAADPCRITFNISEAQLTDGAARFNLSSALPPITGHVWFMGDSQTWWHGNTNADGPEVEIRGGSGLAIGTAASPAAGVYINSVVVNGSNGDGLSVATKANAPVAITSVFSGTDVHGTTALPNAGNGLRITTPGSSSAVQAARAFVAACILSGNEGRGVVLDGGRYDLDQNLIGVDAAKRPLPNVGHGVYVAGGSGHLLERNTIAYNGAAGVATAATVTAPAVVSNVYRNAALGIDVNEDGVSTPDGNAHDGTIDPPVFDRAWYDAAADLTYVEGHDHANVFPMTPTFGLYGEEFGHAFFISAEPDPSGFGEGEQVLAYPLLRNVSGDNGTFRLTLSGDLRGKYVSATTIRFACYWDFGCTMEESSEFSATLQVK